jgi:transporter family-2 protein
MNSLNSRFTLAVGSTLAVLAIHVAGLAAVCLILLFRKEEGSGDRPPFYYYLGGLAGVGTVFTSAYAFSRLGAALAVSVALLGQTLFALTADSTGILGRTRYPLSPRRAPGIALAVAGIAVMSIGTGHPEPLPFLAALAAGAIPGLTFVLNSELGKRLGVFRSTRINYVMGLGTTLAVALVLRPSLVGAAGNFLKAGPLLVLGGGLLGVLVTTAMNLIMPRIPAFTATILLFTGQAAAGLAIDAIARGSLDLRKLLGTAILVAGLALDTALRRQNPEAPLPTRAAPR